MGVLSDETWKHGTTSATQERREEVRSHAESVGTRLLHATLTSFARYTSWIAFNNATPSLIGF